MWCVAFHSAHLEGNQSEDMLKYINLSSNPLTIFFSHFEFVTNWRTLKCNVLVLNKKILSCFFNERERIKNIQRINTASTIREICKFSLNIKP